MLGRALKSDTELRELLGTVRTIAVVGLSPKAHRDSHRVAAYLQGAGYRIIPVHPRGGESLGEKVHTTLTEAMAAGDVDMVNVFRRPDALPDLVAEAIRLGVPALWFQFGVTHPQAEAAALGAGIDMVVDRCALVEHRRLLA